MRESVEVAFHRFVEIAGGDAIECREVRIQHNLLATKQEDGVLDTFDRVYAGFVFHGSSQFHQAHQDGLSDLHRQALDGSLHQEVVLHRNGGRGK